MNLHHWLRHRLQRNRYQPPRRTYLDYAAATPVHPSVVAAMQPYWYHTYGNPSAIHQEGVAAKRALETAREQVARTLGVQTTGVTFTSGGTESIALAIRGTILARQADGVPLNEMTLLTTELEHPATKEAVRALERDGVQVRYLPVDGVGRVVLAEVEAALTPQVVLVSLSYVNSEVGTIEAVNTVGRMIRQYERTAGTRISFHLDAAQAPLWLPCQLARLSVDLLSLDAGKFCGPKGSGALIRQKHVPLLPTISGGGQEAGLRPGTESVAAAVGFATALAWAQAGYEERANSVRSIREYAFEQIADRLPTAVMNGAQGDDRVANNVNLSLPGLDTEYAVVVLDEHGVAASTKSACSSGGGGMSTVVWAMTHDESRAKSTLRLTFGPTVEKRAVDATLDILAQHVVTVQQLPEHF